MSRPAQLEQQLARVKEIQEEMLGSETPKPAPVETEEETTEPQSAEPVTPAVSQEMPATISKEEYDRLEQRYRTLQGMHAADANRFRAELASATAAINDLESRLLAKEKEAKKQEFSPVKYVTQEDEAEYGDTLEMVRRAAREEAENAAARREERYLEQIAALEEQIGRIQSTVVPTVDNLTKAQARKMEADFWMQIDTQVPDWRTINEDENFRAWLIAEDPITGATRQQFLKQAQDQLNASRVVKFFEEWKRSAAGGQTPAPKGKAQPDLERMVAPGASKGAGPKTEQPKRVWTDADIRKFYTDVQTGRYLGKEDERKKLENDLFLAQQDGRYKPN